MQGKPLAYLPRVNGRKRSLQEHRDTDRYSGPASKTVSTQSFPEGEARSSWCGSHYLAELYPDPVPQQQSEMIYFLLRGKKKLAPKK